MPISVYDRNGQSRTFEDATGYEVDFVTNILTLKKGNTTQVATYHNAAWSHVEAK